MQRTTDEFLTYYEILEITESATEEEIKIAYRRLAQEYHPDKVPSHLSKLRYDAAEKFKQGNEAYQVLSNPDARRRYDALLMELRKTAQQSPSSENQTDSSSATSSSPRIELSKNSFNFKYLQRGLSFSDFTITNIGGGTLNGVIKTDKNWLSVSHSNFSISSATQQVVSFDIDTSSLASDFEGTGTIEIQSNGGTERVNVTIAFFKEVRVEVDKVDLSRFRSRLTIGSLTIGGLFGFLIYYLFQELNDPVIGYIIFASIIGITIVASKLGYEEEDGGVAFAAGCFTLIGGVIILCILVNYFPHTFMTVGWALIYGSIANILSKPIRKALWRGDYTIPTMVVIGTAFLTATIVGIGLTAKREREEAKEAREKAIQTISNQLPGEWLGRVSNKEVKLLITRDGNQYLGLTGQIVYDDVLENLSVDFKNVGGDIVLVLKGTSYRLLNRGGNFRLHTFYGQLSSDGHSITGNFVDTAGNRGKWSVLRVSN